MWGDFSPPLKDKCMVYKILSLIRLFYYEILLSSYDISFSQKGPIFFQIEQALEMGSQAKVEEGFSNLKKLIQEAK